MFTALTKNGKLFRIFEQNNPKVLKEIRAKEEFFCPECREKVILKIGNKRLSHFSHANRKACISNAERESEYHINGKLHLFHWLQKQGLNPELEPFYPSIRQRPDIAFIYKNRLYAIEYQCSVISEELFIKRTLHYRKKKIIPVWIIGGRRVKRKSQNKVQFSAFDYLFLTKNANNQWVFPSYCPQSRTWILLDHISPISSLHALSNFTIQKLDEISFRELFIPASYTFSMLDWKIAIRNYKHTLVLRHSKADKAFLQELYQNSLNPFLLPPFIGIPIPQAHLFETAPVLWQSYIVMDHFLPLQKMKSVKFIQINQLFQQRIKKNQIKVRTLPLVKEVNFSIVIKEYLRKLIQLHVIEETVPSNYQVSSNFYIAKSQKEQEEWENQFYNDFAKGKINHRP
ncbi:competence protein CoiA [Bacillus sp. 03113]|uniref:competence protein CoiA n=1 Tax=Bacillus sp. 03113 TaxID=2578211 RepID=UPI0015E8E24D|nr:competence protein CoiA family protein [Bacillus sp. 03113]